MKRIIFMIFLCMALMAGYAQRLSHTFDKASFSKVLVWLDKAQPQYKINFIYDELEDFTVSTSFKNKDVRDIVTQVIGFYPIRATFDKDEIYFECVQKEPQKLIGRVLDDKGAPMEFVNIALLDVRDSSYVNGGVSNLSGDFVIPVHQKQVIARFSYVGYKTQYKRVNVGKMGSIRLFRDAYTLNKVVVKAYKPLFQRKEDKTVFNVSELKNIGAMNATDVLKYAPKVMVQDDASGGVNIKVNNTEATIFVNDRKLAGTELKSFLSSIKADDIQSIEIQDTHGAEHDADIKGGIVHIRTRIRAGFNGSITGYVGNLSPESSKFYSYYPLLNLNLGTERWNVYASTYYIWARNALYCETQHHFMETDTHHLVAQTYDNRQKLYFYRVGSIYAIDKKHHHLLGAELNGNINKRHAVSAGDCCKFTDANKMTYQGVSDMNDHNNTDYLNAVLSYNWKIDEKDSYLKVLGNYNYKHANKGNSFVASYEDYEPLHTDEYNQSTSNANTGSLQTDFRYNFPSSLALRLGSKYENNIRTTGLNIRNNLVEGDLTSSDWKYQEQVAAAYLGLSKNFGEKVFAYLSMRMENTWQKGINRLTDKTEVDKRYTNWFPYAYLSYKFNDKSSMSLTYSSSINRPSFGDLTNNKERISAVLYTTGNPNVQPSISNSLIWELTHGNHSLSFSYKHRKDVIAEYFETIGDKTYRDITNFGSETIVGADYAFNGKILPWWNLNMGLAGYYDDIPKSYNVKHIWVVRGNCVNYLTFKKIGSFSVEGNYSTSTIDANYKSHPLGYVCLGYNRTFLKDALSLGFSVFDVFHTLRQKGYQLNPVLDYEFYQKAYSRYSLTLTYSFHNKYKARKGQIQNDNSIINRL